MCDLAVVRLIAVYTACNIMGTKYRHQCHKYTSCVSQIQNTEIQACCVQNRDVLHTEYRCGAYRIGSVHILRHQFWTPYPPCVIKIIMALDPHPP